VGVRRGCGRGSTEGDRGRVAGRRVRVNERYVSLVYRPQPTAVGSAALKLFGRAESDTARAELAESLEACEKLRSQVLAGLAAYEPEVLGLRAGECAGPRRSSLLEFLGLLVNGERQALALPTAVRELRGSSTGGKMAWTRVAYRNALL